MISFSAKAIAPLRALSRLSAGLLALALFTTAAANELPLRSAAEDPCWVQDGNLIAAALPYAVVMIDDPSSDPEEVQAIFARALAADCPVNETDDTGSTALIYAIIFNRAEMAEQLLNAGANAYVRLRHDKPQLNGKNAFEVFELISASQPLTDRSKLRRVLEQQHRRHLSKLD